MIVVDLVRDRQGRLGGFSVKGHAGFARRGQDIVCAAVSALTETTALGLAEVAGLAVEVRAGEGFLACRLPAGLTPEDRARAELLLETMVLGLREAARQYPAHLEVREREEGS